jgi:hypothetical protein
MSYPTAYTVDCCEPDKCWARPCMRAGEDKGSFTPGRGYTSYYKKPKAVCVTRQFHGCPHPLPEPDPENARCCFRPDYYNVRRDRKAVPCRTCGATAPGAVAKVLRDLPTLPGVHCRHEKQKDGMITGWRECSGCRGHWKDRHHVQPFEPPTHTFEEMLDELTGRLKGGAESG